MVSPALPVYPSLAEDTVRAVRHGLADVLEWLGEAPGPRPGAITHAVHAGGTLWVSAEMFAKLKAASLTGRQDYR
jgi:hypothetical protein